MDLKRMIYGGVIAVAATGLLTAATMKAPPPPDTSPAGMVAFFGTNSCPSGWAEVNKAWQGRYMVAASGNAGATVGTALTAGENRPTGDHTHGAPVSFYGGNCPTNPTGNCVRWAEAGAGRGPRDVGGVVTYNQGETVVAGTNAPYVALRACIKK